MPGCTKTILTEKAHNKLPSVFIIKTGTEAFGNIIQHITILTIHQQHIPFTKIINRTMFIDILSEIRRNQRILIHCRKQLLID